MFVVLILAWHIWMGSLHVSNLRIFKMSNFSKGKMDISPKLYEQYCTYYVSLPSSPILLVTIETLELLGRAVCLLVQF